MLLIATQRREYEPLREIENIISALKSGDIAVARICETAPLRRPVGFHPTSRLSSKKCYSRNYHSDHCQQLLPHLVQKL
jgi:hypothetical protein